MSTHRKRLGIVLFQENLFINVHTLWGEPLQMEGYLQNMRMCLITHVLNSNKHHRKLKSAVALQWDHSNH